jgi:TolA-binding protein
MRYSVPGFVLACALIIGAQQPPPAPKPAKPSSELIALRQEIETEIRRMQMENDVKLQQALQQARMDSRQEIESLRREVQSLQQTVWALQSRVRD